MHFWEIINLQFGKERHTLLCILELYTNIVHKLSFKNACYPQFSFWISITLVKIYISCIIINRGRNTFELVGTVLTKRWRRVRECHKTIGLISEHNSSARSARALHILVHFLVVFVLATTWNDQIKFEVKPYLHSLTSFPWQVFLGSVNGKIWHVFPWQGN